MWQAHFTQEKLSAIGIESELIIINTTGDQIQHLSFDKMEGKGFFTKEIEDALLRGEIDLAVHSMKDLPTNAPEGLVISAWGLVYAGIAQISLELCVYIHTWVPESHLNVAACGWIRLD